jgi:DNA-binding MarR family transcriptional regulator
MNVDDQDDRFRRSDAARPEVREAVEAVSSLVRSSDGFRHRAAAEAQVGLTELRALGRIMVAGSLSPKQLAEALDLTTGTVTALLDRLERAGLVARSPHPRDRRMLQIELTPLGRDRYSGVLANWDRQVVMAAETMPRETLLATVEFLRRLEGLITSEQSGWGTREATA